MLALNHRNNLLIALSSEPLRVVKMRGTVKAVVAVVFLRHGTLPQTHSGSSPFSLGRLMIFQRKTGRPVQFEVTEQTRRSIAAWVEIKGLGFDDWLFPSRMKLGWLLSTRQYARLVDKWVCLVGLDPAAYGTHSLRRTKVALLYKKTGNLRACQLLLGHTKLESTARYLGVEVDDALELSEALEL